MLPALGRGKDHANPPPGLSIKHFVVAGLLGTALLVGGIVMVVRLLLAMLLTGTAGA